MTDSHPDLLVTQEAVLDEEILKSFAPPAGIRRFKSLAEVRQDLEHSVVIISANEAGAALSRRKTEQNSATLKFSVVLWMNDPEQNIDRTLLDHPQVAGALDVRCPRETVYATLKTAVALLRESGEQRAAQMLEHVLEIGRALASEKDLDTLLGLILTHARNLTGADGASVYTRDSNGKLYFRLWQNASTGGATSNAQKTLVGDRSIAGYVAREGKTVMLKDAYSLSSEAPYQFNPASDRSIGYRTKSLLTVPLKNKTDEVVGVLQLINRKDHADTILRRPEDFENHVQPFDEQDRAIALALAGQAGVALENSMLYADIERLFEGFIMASVQAIEARDPTTAGHSFRVAEFTERTAVATDRTDAPGLRDVTFSKDQLRELRYAALLHDFGKVGVRENVLVKAKKLQPHQLELLRQRFRYARASIERRAYKRLLELHNERIRDSDLASRRSAIEQELNADQARLETYLQHVLRANEPTVSHEQISVDLEEVANFRFPGEGGEALPLLHDFEFTDLALSKGSLNVEERAQIESHVSHTYAFLSLIPWTRNLANLPEIAFSHHEKLDGSGYPRRLVAEKIPVQSRIMTIADIYDALTAGDRPYKAAMPEDKALDILAAEARASKIDAGLYKVFVESGAWRLRH